MVIDVFAGNTKAEEYISVWSWGRLMSFIHVEGFGVAIVNQDDLSVFQG